MKRAVGAGGRRIVFCGLLIFLTLLKFNVLQASEVTPINSYLNFLEGSIFDGVTGTVNGNSGDIPSYVTEKVTLYIEYFTTKERDLFQQWLDRAGPFIPLIREIFREEGLPEDLALLPLIESGFRVDAKSPKKATGLWQFMASTGTLYGLRVNKWVDERNDPVKSTRAAARHLKDLYNTFGTWPLALASYNAGSGRVKRALASTGSSDFWEMGQSRALKAETRNYIPKFMAALIIAKNPEVFGFTFSEGPSIRYDIVEVPGGMELAGIVKDAGTDYRSLRGLNPELKSNILPFDRPHYTLRLPEGKGAVFLENYNSLPLSQRNVYREHRVKKGDTVYGIARRYRTDVAAIKKTNRLDWRYKIIPGDVLLIPVRLPMRAGNVRLVISSEEIQPKQPETL